MVNWDICKLDHLVFAKFFIILSVNHFGNFDLYAVNNFDGDKVISFFILFILLFFNDVDTHFHSFSSSKLVFVNGY